MKAPLRILPWILVLGLAATSAGAEEIGFSAAVDKERLTADDRLVLTLSVTGARNAPQPELPRIEGFEVVSSGTTSQFNFIQGKMFASRAFTYVLIPKGVGTFTIGEARFRYDGKVYRSDPIAVEVVQGTVRTRTAPVMKAQPVPPDQPQIDLGDRLFVQVRADKDEVYLNEQVVITFRLYRRNMSLDDIQYTAPSTVGFIEESLGKQKETRELINGIMYDVIELKTALFPASSGELTIGPAKLSCNILVRTRQRRERGPRGLFEELFDDSLFRDSFFDRYSKYPVDLQSKPLSIRVLPLPAENRPEGFAGAVGDYQMEAWIEPKALTVGEPANLTMRVVGTGNISGLAPPATPDLPAFKTYESESKVSLQDRVDAFGGEKVFEKVLIPQKAGKLKIPPVVFSFFNPRSGRYETLSEGPFWLDVEESAEGRTAMIVSRSGAGMAKEDVRILKRDILFIKEDAGELRRQSGEWIGRPWFWWAQAFPLLFLLGAVLLKRGSEGSDAARKRHRQAYAKARAAMHRAQKAVGGAQPAAFYHGMYQALGSYVSDRWNLASGEVTPRDMTDVLGPKGLSAPLAGKAAGILERIDQGRFAAASISAEEMKALGKEVAALIKELEKASG